MPSVVFSTNCYKKDFDYLSMSGFHAKKALNDFDFDLSAIILNGVEDVFPEADCVLNRTELTPPTLKYFDLTRDDFVDQSTGKDGYIYSIDSLIELFLFRGYDYIVHYCGDVELYKKNNWITEGIKQIETGEFCGARPRLPIFAESSREEMALTEYNIFSDHVYLLPVALFDKDRVKQMFVFDEPSCVPPHPEYGGQSFERRMSRLMHVLGWKLAVIQSAIEIPIPL